MALLNDAAIKMMVRMLFGLTRRDRTTHQTKAALERYMLLSQRVDGVDGARPVMVPKMRGIDEDMRNWSFYMILAHNTIVNRSITSIVQQLSRQQYPKGMGAIDPKKDVMPPKNCGEEQIDRFRRSVENHLKTTAHLGPLRGTRKKNHSVFGPFDAHRWNCMFSFHLKLHYRQALYVVKRIQARR